MRGICNYMALLIGVFAGFASLAPARGVTPPSVVPWYTPAVLNNPFAGAAGYADTTITGFQRYDFHTRESLFYAGKGNVGHNARILRFDPLPQTGFMLFSYPVYPGYRFTGQDLRFYRPQHVFSELFYVTGSANEQLFYAKHHQRFHEEVVAGLKFQAVNSPGFYSRMAARNANLMLTAEVERGTSYHLMGSFVVNRIENQESGGLRDRRRFEEDEVRDSVFFYNATSRYRETAFRFSHTYHPGLSPGSDTLPRQSYFNPGRFRHDFTYHRKAFVFEQPGTPADYFYDAEPLRTDATFDSTRVRIMENRLSWSSFPLQQVQNPFPVNLTLYARHQLIRIELPYPEAVNNPQPGNLFVGDDFSQLEKGALLETDPSHLLSADAFARLTSGGYNDGDFGLGGGLGIGGQDRSVSLRLSLSYAANELPYFLNRFRSNYVSWENDPGKMRTLNVRASLGNPAFSLQLDYYRVSGMGYMDADAFPARLDERLSVFSGGLTAGFDLGLIRSEHKVVYHSMGRPVVERFPALSGIHSVYADFELFDRALHAHAGFDLRHNSDYRPMAYMPMVWQFYLQNDYQSGNVVVLDAFLNAKISRARLFVKLEHVLDLLFDLSPVYEIPFYPLPSNMFRFGVSWLFFD